MLKPRDYLRYLAPYELPKKFSVEDIPPLLLAQNENYTEASIKALEAARGACANSTRYPDPDTVHLCNSIADLHGIDPDRIVCARGAMELISLLAMVYLEPGASAVTSQFGYLYFQTATELAGARIIKAPEPRLIVDPAAIGDCVDKATRIVFIANPGNPTGSYLNKSDLIRIRSSLPDSVLLVIDEAYAEFVEPNLYQACFEMADEGATVVLRTFSKIYGLAGLRIGWGYFPFEIATLLRVFQQPNSVTGPGQAAATAATQDQQHVVSLQERTIQIRNSFTESLYTLGLNPLSSQTNFVLVRFQSSAAAASADVHLRSDAIVVRRMDGYGLPDCLRITLGTPEQMQRVTDSLTRWIDPQ